MSRLRSLVLAAAVIAASLVVVSASPAAAFDCTNISASTFAATNQANIQGCLDATGTARLLNNGVFAISGLIVMPSNATLTRAATVPGDQYPTIRLTSAQEAVVEFPASASGSTVSGLMLQANGFLSHPATAGVVLFLGGGNTVSNAYLEPTSSPSQTVDTDDTSVYFACHSCTGNKAQGIVARNGFYGVNIHTHAGRAGALLENSLIFNNNCDSVTIGAGWDEANAMFLGSGIVRNNWIYNNGPNCNNGAPGRPPVPGGGIYSLNNTGGFLVEGNQIVGNCSMGIDLVNVGGAEVKNNILTNPGNTALSPGCAGSIGMGMVNVWASTITNNIVQTVNIPSNRIQFAYDGDPNDIFRNTGAPAFSDLPFGGNTAIATVLATWPGSYASTGNWIANNSFVANCASPCQGVGFFTSRDTGYGPGRTWNAYTTNYMIQNNVAGSNYGSRRGGGNWWGGGIGTSCTASNWPYPCNNDDYQHNPPVGNDFRNDVGLQFYS